MIEIRFIFVGALDCRINEARTISPQRLEERARIAAVLRARFLITGIEGTESTIRPEVRALPKIHQAENAGLDTPHAGCGVALEQMQFLEPFENPEWEIDLDAMRIEDLAVEFVRQSFANQQLVDSGAPARSRRIFLRGLQRLRLTARRNKSVIAL